MKRSLFRLVCGLAILALGASPAWAQRGRHNGTVSTPYGTFSAAEMAQAGGDATTAAQMREQRSMIQQQQQLFKQQQQVAKDQAKQKDFLKKHPEAARAFAAPATKATKKKTDKKDKVAAATAKDDKSGTTTAAAATAKDDKSGTTTAAAAKTKKSS